MKQCSCLILGNLIELAISDKTSINMKTNAQISISFASNVNLLIAIGIKSSSFDVRYTTFCLAKLNIFLYFSRAKNVSANKIDKRGKMRVFTQVILPNLRIHMYK
jgi:hypothetical protein